MKDYDEDCDDFLIFLDDGYYLVDGSETENDFIVSNGKTGLSEFLANGASENRIKDMPIIRNVKAMLSGPVEMKKKHELFKIGVWLFENSIILDRRWKIEKEKSGAPFPTEIWFYPEKNIRLETVLEILNFHSRD